MTPYEVLCGDLALDTATAHGRATLSGDQAKLQSLIDAVRFSPEWQQPP
jgi:hypothetical protein